MGGDDKNTTNSKKTKEKKSSKVNFSLGKKKKKKDSLKAESSLSSGSAVSSKKESKRITFNAAGDNDEYTTTAEAASIETKRRKELGIELIIPLKPEGEDGKKKEPLLSGLKRIINGEKDEGLKEKSAVNNLSGGNTGDRSSANNKDGIDEEAEAALIQLATENQKDKRNYDSTTNFSSRGSSLVIQQQQESGVKITQKNNSESDAMKYQRDLQHRAEDVSVDSKAYVNVPISEFGAAMLRGMGWKTKDSNDDMKKDKEFNPRPHRLGLGATPLPPSMKKGENDNSNKNNNRRHRAKKGGMMGDRAKIEKEEDEERNWKMKREEKMRNDIQITLQVGSIVRVRNDESGDDLQGMRRAKMVKTGGVPGLNRVLVCYEGESADVSVKKGDVILVSKSDLEIDPFCETEHKSSEKCRENNHDQRKLKRSSNEATEKNRSSRSGSRENKRSRKDDRRERSHTRERSKRHQTSRDGESEDGSNHGKSKRDKERSRDRKKHKHSDEKSNDKRGRDDGYDSSERKGDESRKRKKSKHEKKSHQKSTEHWLTPNIRVRIVTKKIAKGRQYKQKGVVMDVLNQGTYAIVHMDNGELIERVPERYMETALPKVGGNAIILTGTNQFAKGKLLERNSSQGQGIIQLFEDMNVVTLGLDDMAEWCGALDDDYMN